MSNGIPFSSRNRAVPRVATTSKPISAKSCTGSEAFRHLSRRRTYPFRRQHTAGTELRFRESPTEIRIKAHDFAGRLHLWVYHIDARKRWNGKTASLTAT